MSKANQILMDLTVNSNKISMYVQVGRRLLDFLRDDLHLTGTKEGCGEGECGSLDIHGKGGWLFNCDYRRGGYPSSPALGTTSSH
jgi:carbon-monoxide dehydrogenase small subunit